MILANIRDNKIIDFNSKYLDKDITTVETTQEMYKLFIQDSRTIIYKDGEIVKNPEYENILAEEKRQKQIDNIKQQLHELDLKSIRAIRTNDAEYLEIYEAQAIGLRSQLSKLSLET